MPPPVIYVVAVVAGVAAGLAFKQFVYDPHLAPTIEAWAQTVTEFHKERRWKRAPQHAERPHTDSDNDDAGDREESKSSVELRGSIFEQELQELNHGGVFRRRKQQDSKGGEMEMLEKPNTFVPFEPLTPEKARSPPSTAPTPLTCINLPINRLPTPVSDPSSSTLSPSPHRHATSPSTRSASTSHFEADSSMIVNPPPLSGPAADPHVESHQVFRPGSEYDFVVPSDAGNSLGSSGSRGMTPLPRSNASSVDEHSDASFDFLSSDVESSDAGLSYVEDSDVDVVPSHAGTDFEQPLHDGDLLQPPQDARSDIGSDDWDRV